MLAVAVLQRIWLPGFDAGLMGEWFRATSMQPVILSVLGGSLGWLVLIRGGLAWLAGRGLDFRRPGIVIYLTINAVIGLTIAISGREMAIGGMAVYDATGANAALGVASSLGAAALVWWLATSISRTGWASGPLLLVFAGSITADLLGPLHYGQAYGRMDSVVVYVPVLPYMATGFVLLALTMDASWPRALPGGWNVRSWVDVALLPWLAGILGLTMGNSVDGAILRADPYVYGRIVGYGIGFGSVGAAMASLLCAAVLILWLAKQRQGWTLRVAWLAIPLCLWSGGLYAVGYADGSGAFVSGPFDGNETATMLLTAQTGARVHDEAVIRARLQGIGVTAKLEGEPGGGLLMTVRNVSSRQEVADAVLQRGLIAFHEVASAPVLGSVPAESCYNGACETLHVLPAVMDRRHIRSASVASNHNGMPYVRLQFTQTGGQLFGQLSTRLTGQRFAIIVDGVVFSAPTIMEPILGGVASIDMGGVQDPALEARGLAVALSERPLSAKWSWVDAP
jgi:hypothetical protein